jgi:hypothetical protein
VLGADRHPLAIKIFEISGRDIDGADRKPRLATIDPVEVNQPFQRVPQRSAVVS